MKGYKGRNLKYKCRNLAAKRLKPIWVSTEKLELRLQNNCARFSLLRQGKFLRKEFCVCNEINIEK